jgi:hypothetical protein
MPTEPGVPVPSRTGPGSATIEMRSVETTTFSWKLPAGTEDDVPWLGRVGRLLDRRSHVDHARLCGGRRQEQEGKRSAEH